MTSTHRIRTRFVFIGMTAIAAVLIFTLYSTQVTSGSKYKSRAESQYNKPSQTFFDRGSIFFSIKDGTHVAAANIEKGNIIYVNPKQAADLAQIREALAEYISIDDKAFDKALKQGAPENAKNVYVEVAHKVNDSTAASIMALKLKGISRAPESWRSYPGGILAAQTLGIIGEDQSTSTIHGKYGIERSYENVLARSGKGGNASLFAELFDGVEQAFAKDKKEGNVVTTIEPTVQAYLENVLSETGKTWHPDEIGGIILDPNSGEIISLASLPTFNGNDTSVVKDVSVFSNPLVEHVYEMGSIIKPLTVAAGLDSGAISPQWTYNDEGTMTLNEKTIGNWDRRAHGTTGLQEILSQSLNMGAATIGLKVGKNDMAEYFGRLGLGEKTGIDLPNEAAGLVKNFRTGQDIDIATASYGQGIAVSPVAVARALAVLANGGKSITPHIVKEIEYADGEKKVPSFPGGEKVLKTETSREVTGFLVRVVDEALKKGEISNPRYTIAAKTGTAQIPDHVNGGYYADRYLHSFFGYFPAYSPRFLVFLYQIHPKGAQYASETLTVPFGNLAKFLINYYDVPPDR